MGILLVKVKWYMLPMGNINKVLSVMHPLRLFGLSVLKYSYEFLTHFLDVRACDKGFLCGFLVQGLVHMRSVICFFEEPVRVAVPAQNLV